MVARQLHRMSKVPRILGAETKLCRDSVGMVQFGLANVEASVDAAASRNMESNTFRIMALVPVPLDWCHRAAMPMPLSKQDSQAQTA